MLIDPFHLLGKKEPPEPWSRTDARQQREELQVLYNRFGRNKLLYAWRIYM